jgi:flavorubredoxin
MRAVFWFEQNLKYCCSTLFETITAEPDMTNVLVVYNSLSWNTERMTYAIAEGVVENEVGVHCEKC